MRRNHAAGQIAWREDRAHHRVGENRHRLRARSERRSDHHELFHALKNAGVPLPEVRDGRELLVGAGAIERRHRHLLHYAGRDDRMTGAALFDVDLLAECELRFVERTECIDRPFR